MSKDISKILDGWNYEPGELRIRAIDGRDCKRKIQIRVDLGIMQLEWANRPDGSRPHDRCSLLDYYQGKLGESVETGDSEKCFVLSREDCWALGQEAMQYYWRRISFFELKEYEKAEADAEHNLAILDLCQRYAEHDEDRQVADQYRVFVTAHRIQARTLQLLQEEKHKDALDEIRRGICEVEHIIQDQVDVGIEMEECPELKFLREWEKEVEGNRPLTSREKLHVDLQAAIEEEKFELAASLRDKIRRLSD